MSVNLLYSNSVQTIGYKWIVQGNSISTVLHEVLEYLPIINNMGNGSLYEKDWIFATEVDKEINFRTVVSSVHLVLLKKW